ncbi:MAG: hypothetical protein HC811_08355 [Flammeovirgaceae bacterium]|nr:hypothetical protein [Flammeovirgaceae bacterium]
MSNYRKLKIVDIPNVHFAHEDVLTSFEDRYERDHKLRSAMAQSNTDHDSIALIVQLDTGEVVRIKSKMIDYGGNFVEVMGGYDIPLRAILNVEI